MEAFFRQDPSSTGTKGLVFIGDDVLIYRRDTNTNKFPLHLDVPGGGKEGNETPFATFRREVMEEFGLVIDKSDIIYARRYPSGFDKGKFGWYAVATLPALAKENIIFGDEGLEYMLMPLADFLGRKDAWAAYQHRASDYLASISSIK